MSRVPELQTLCELHKVKISIACFYKGCNQTLLCRNCFRNHPQEHEPEIKDLTDIINDNSWIETIERQKSSELDQMEGIYQLKKEILAENEHLLNEFVKSIKACIEAQKQIWFKQLNESMGFSELDRYLSYLRNLEFPDDIFERIQKVKNFNDDVVPNVRHLIVSFQSNSKKWKLDKEKVEGYKAELTEIIQKIGIKSMLADEPFRSLKISEEQIVLEQEYRELKNLTNIQLEKLESLSHKNEDIINENTRLQNELNEMIETNAYLEKDYEKETAVLKSQIATLEKLKKIAIFEPESSTIIQTTDFGKLKEWIPKPLHLNTTKLVLLYRASRDGWSAQSFHAKCDNITPTISVIKSQDYGKIFGGYTSKDWGLNSGWVEDQDAFIFSLTHGEKYECKDPYHAIHSDPRYMVAFGGASDIFINGDCNTVKPHGAGCNFPWSYTCSRFSSSSIESRAYFAGAGNFKVEELEVYHIMFC